MIGPHAVGGFKPLKLQGLKAPFEVLANVGPEGPTPFLELTSPWQDTTPDCSTALRERSPRKKRANHDHDHRCFFGGFFGLFLR